MRHCEGTGPPPAPGKKRLKRPSPTAARGIGAVRGEEVQAVARRGASPTAERQPRPGPEALASATESLCLSFCLAACTL